MLYKDSAATKDHDEGPANRPGEVCLHCDRLHGEHRGWRCPDVLNYGSVYFSQLLPAQRYFTQSMLVSLDPENVPSRFVYKYRSLKLFEVKPVLDISDWRAWARREPGECPCGIPYVSGRCTYYKR